MMQKACFRNCAENIDDPLSSVPQKNSRKRNFRFCPAFTISLCSQMVAEKFGTGVIFTRSHFPHKLSSLYTLFSWSMVKKLVCDMKHTTKLIECAALMVCKISLSCRSVHIGQTGRFLNNWRREHGASLNKNNAQYVCLHCKARSFYLLYRNTEVLGRLKDKLAREILEAPLIHRFRRDACHWYIWCWFSSKST